MRTRILGIIAAVVLSLGLFASTGGDKALAYSNCEPNSGGTCHPCQAPVYQWYLGYYWTGFSYAPYYYPVLVGWTIEWHSEPTGWQC